MEFGLLYDFSNPAPWRRAFPEHYRLVLDHIAAAEGLGFHSVWLAENHFSEDGLCPSVLTMAAAIAARTERVRIGTSVLLLPLAHPVRVAEEVAVVDNLSSGRLVVGLGRGYRREEFQAYGLSRAQKGPIFEEALRVFVGALTEPGFTFQGRYFRVEGLNLSPPPVQRPHPPIYLGARGEAATHLAARLGYPLIVIGGRHQYGVYSRALVEEGRDPADYPVAMLRAFVVARDPARARAALEPHIAHRRQAFQRRVASLPAAIREPQEAVLGPMRHPFIATPEACVEEIRRFVQDIPVDTLILPALYPGQDPGQALDHLELFAGEVVPHFLGQRGSSVR